VGKNMLLGQFDSKISANGRTGFPKRFRDVLGDKLIITQGFEKSLIVVSEEGWKSLLEGTEGQPFTHADARQTQRFLLGGAAFAELDEKGRFILPDYLVNYAELTEEVVFIGMSRFVEIWDKKRWQEYNKELQGNINTITQRLSREGKTET
jgi:MraZ protein